MSQAGGLAYEVFVNDPPPQDGVGGVGHNLPQEAPQAFAEAVIDVASL